MICQTSNEQIRKGFLGKVKFGEFLANSPREYPGEAVDARKGEILCRHHGVCFYIVGNVKEVAKWFPWLIQSQNRVVLVVVGLCIERA